MPKTTGIMVVYHKKITSPSSLKIMNTPTTGMGGSQMAFWTCYADRTSKIHKEEITASIKGQLVVEWGVLPVGAPEVGLLVWSLEYREARRYKRGEKV